jgi:hypothetical protein
VGADKNIPPSQSMAKSNKKSFYAVARGRAPGIYTTCVLHPSTPRPPSAPLEAELFVVARVLSLTMTVLLLRSICPPVRSIHPLHSTTSLPLLRGRAFCCVAVSLTTKVRLLQGISAKVRPIGFPGPYSRDSARAARLSDMCKRMLRRHSRRTNRNRAAQAAHLAREPEEDPGRGTSLRLALRKIRATPSSAAAFCSRQSRLRSAHAKEVCRRLMPHAVIRSFAWVLAVTLSSVWTPHHHPRKTRLQCTSRTLRG